MLIRILWKINLDFCLFVWTRARYVSLDGLCLDFFSPDFSYFLWECMWHIIRRERLCSVSGLYCRLASATVCKLVDHHMPRNALWRSVEASCGNLSVNELTRNLSGDIRPQSSQLAEPLLTDPGIMSGTRVRKLISHLKKKRKKLRPGMNGRTFSHTPHKRGKSHHHHTTRT